MPRDSNGIYTLPLGTLASAGQTLVVSQHNPAMLDIADALTQSLTPDTLPAALKGKTGFFGAFSTLSTEKIPTEINRLTTSGPGAAWYIADTALTDADVAAHPLAITKTANGRFFRLDPMRVSLSAFGADPTGVIPSTSALRALIKYCAAFSLPGSSYGGGRGCYVINLEAGTYLIDDLVSIKGFTAVWRGGATSGGYAAGSSTRFKCTANGRFSLDRGDTGDPAYTAGADGSIFEHILFEGSRAGYNLFTAHCRFHFFYTSCVGSGYHGLYIHANATAPAGDPSRGNANCWSVYGGEFTYNLGSGICASGADANAGQAHAISCIDNERYGVEDLSFLGNNFNGHFRSNALGSLFNDNLNANVGVPFMYSEAGSPRTKVTQSGLIVGGTHGSGTTYDSPYIYGRFGSVASNGLITERYKNDYTAFATVTINNNYASNIILDATRSDITGNRTFMFSGKDFSWGNGVGGNDQDHIITGVGTSYTLGRTSPVSYGVNIFRRGFSLGSRLWSETNSIPATTDAAQGEIQWNIDPTPGGPVAWVRSAGAWRPTGIVGATRASGLTSSSSAADIVAALKAAGLAT